MAFGNTDTLAAESIANLSSQTTVTPKHGGTKGSPRPVVIEGVLDWRHLYDVSPPTHLRVLLSKRLMYSSRGRAACSPPATYEEALECPDDSVIGSLSAGGDPAFNAFCSSSVLLVKGGLRRIYVAANGGCAHFDDVEVGTVAKMRNDRKWSYKLTLPMPGVFSYSTSTSDGAFMYFSLGSKVPGHSGWWAEDVPPPSGYWRTTGCPASGRHAVRVEIPHSGRTDAGGVAATRAVSRCRPAISPAPAGPS